MSANEWPDWDTIKVACIDHQGVACTDKFAHLTEGQYETARRAIAREQAGDRLAEAVREVARDMHRAVGRCEGPCLNADHETMQQDADTLTKALAAFEKSRA